MFRRRKILQRDILEILSKDFGITHVSRISPLQPATNTCYRIESPAGQFVLKQFPSRYFNESAKDEPSLTRFLVEQEIPAAKFISTRGGRYAVRYRRYVFHLQEFVEGKVYQRNSCPFWLMAESADLLGRIQKALREYRPLPERFDTRWFSHGLLTKVGKYFSSLIRLADRLPPDSVRERILRDLDYKRSQLAEISRIPIDPERLTRRNSHGDYQTTQLICGTDCIRAVIDFSSACAPPAAWEIMRSYVFGDPACAEGKIDSENLKNYVLRYMKHLPLSHYDLEMMPHLLRMHFVRKRYGFKEYLTGDAPNKRALLEEGFWATDLARWLEKNAEELSKELVKLA